VVRCCPFCCGGGGSGGCGVYCEALDMEGWGYHQASCALLFYRRKDVIAGQSRGGGVCVCCGLPAARESLPEARRRGGAAVVRKRSWVRGGCKARQTKLKHAPQRGPGESKHTEQDTRWASKERMQRVLGDDNWCCVTSVQKQPLDAARVSV
jgi:hypothetical protein